MYWEGGTTVTGRDKRFVFLLNKPLIILPHKRLCWSHVNIRHGISRLEYVPGFGNTMTKIEWHLKTQDSNQYNVFNYCFEVHY